MKLKPTENPDLFELSHTVLSSQDGMRLDLFLKEHYRRRSRQKIQAAIDEGRVTVLRSVLGQAHLPLGKIKASQAVLQGDTVILQQERKGEPEVNLDYRILYEDEVLLVVDKPPNLPVHPAGSYYFNTLLTHFKTQGHGSPLKKGQDYYLPHRIDKETSGILVVAKDPDTCAKVVEQFANRTTEKTYRAIVRGVPADAEFETDLPMRRSRTSRVALKMEVVRGELIASDEVLTARTVFRRVRCLGTEFAEVECFPKTGRQHQIRVHLEALGHPIVGDKLYGRSEQEAIQFYERWEISPESWAKLLHPRHALHAAGLKFIHPLLKKEVQFESPLPPDLVTLWEQLSVQTKR